MKEFSSYYYVKANEIPLSDYADVSYFEREAVTTKSAIQSTTVVKDETFKKLPTKYTMDYCHE